MRLNFSEVQSNDFVQPIEKNTDSVDNTWPRQCGS